MIIHNPVITGSLQVNGTSVSSIDQVDNISGSVVTLTDASASLAAGKLNNTTDTLTGDLTVTGKITAQEFHTEFVSASILYDSGSTQFGNSADDTHKITGSFNVKGNTELDGTVTLTDLGYFIGSSTYGFRFNTAADDFNNVIFYDNGNSYFRGNIGIGTPNANQTLTVNGDFKALGLWTNTSSQTFWGNAFADTAYGFLTWDTGYAAIAGKSGNELRLGANEVTNHLVIDTDGNVGINRVTPSYRLDVGGGSGFRDTLRVLANDINTVNLSWTATNTGLVNLYHGGTLTTQLIANGTSYFNGGGVAINTTSTTSGFSLDVNGNSKVRYLSLGRSGQNYDSIGYNVSFTGTSNNWNYTTTDTTSLLTFELGGFIFRGAGTGTGGNPITFTEYMRIESSGEVGIGTDNPVRKLVISNNGANGIELDPNISGLSEIISYNRSTQAYTPLHFEASRYYFGSGNVGIANTSPTNYSGYKMLHIGDGTVGNTGIIKLGTGSTANGPEIYAATVGGVNRLLLNTDASTNVMVLEGSNIGIGGAPSYKLDVRSSTQAAKFTAGDGGYAAVLFDGDDGNTVGSLTTHNGTVYIGSVNAGGTGSNGEIRIEPFAGNIIYLKSGKAGVNQTSPQYQLDVAGPIRASRHTRSVHYYGTTDSASNQYFHIKTSVSTSQVCMHTWHIEGYSYGSGAILDERFAFHTDASGNIYTKSYKGTYANNIYNSADNYVVLVFGQLSTYYTHFNVNLFEGMYTPLNSTVLAVTYSSNNSGVY